MPGKYQIEFIDGVAFKRFLKKFDEKHQRLIVEAIQIELADVVPALQNQQNIRPLGKGLYELKIKSAGELLVRVFFAFAPNRQIWVVHFYDKKSNDSVRFQNKQIQLALAKIKNNSII